MGLDGSGLLQTHRKFNHIIYQWQKIDKIYFFLESLEPLWGLGSCLGCENSTIMYDVSMLVIYRCTDLTSYTLLASSCGFDAIRVSCHPAEQIFSDHTILEPLHSTYMAAVCLYGKLLRTSVFWGLYNHHIISVSCLYEVIHFLGIIFDYAWACSGCKTLLLSMAWYGHQCKLLIEDAKLQIKNLYDIFMSNLVCQRFQIVGLRVWDLRMHST